MEKTNRNLKFVDKKVSFSTFHLAIGQCSRVKSGQLAGSGCASLLWGKVLARVEGMEKHHQWMTIIDRSGDVNSNDGMQRGAAQRQ